MHLDNRLSSAASGRSSAVYYKKLKNRKWFQVFSLLGNLSGVKSGTSPGRTGGASAKEVRSFSQKFEGGEWEGCWEESYRLKGVEREQRRSPVVYREGRNRRGWTPDEILFFGRVKKKRFWEEESSFRVGRIVARREWTIRWATGYSKTWALHFFKGWEREGKPGLYLGPGIRKELPCAICCTSRTIAKRQICMKYLLGTSFLNLSKRRMARMPGIHLVKNDIGNIMEGKGGVP